MKKKSKKDTGITLIALVVTIVVLIILAAVSIAILSGDNGLITKAKEAAKETNLANTAERIGLDYTVAKTEASINGDGNITDKQLQEIISNNGGTLQPDGDTITTDDGDLSLKEIIGNTTIINRDEEIERLKERIRELETIIEQLRKQTQPDNTELENLRQQLTEKETEIVTLKEQIADLQTQLEAANARITELEQRIAELEAEIANLNQRIEELEAQLAEANATIESLQNTVDELRAQVADLQEQLDAATATIAELTKKQATGDALAADVLAGKIFSTSNGIGLEGTMPNNGAVTQTLNAGGSYTIPVGYHNGSGKITVNSLASQTSATATAAQILTGKTAWVNGSKITGTMANRGALNWNPGSSTTYTVQPGYYSGGTLNSSGAYNAGVTAADNRANTNSTNYKTGYNAGLAANKYGANANAKLSIASTGSQYCTSNPYSFTISTAGYYLFVFSVTEFNAAATGCTEFSVSSGNVIYQNLHTSAAASSGTLNRPFSSVMYAYVNAGATIKVAWYNYNGGAQVYYYRLT